MAVSFSPPCFSGASKISNIGIHSQVKSVKSGDYVFARMKSTCTNGMILEVKKRKGLTRNQCQTACDNKRECTAVEHTQTSNPKKKNKCTLFKRCDGEYTNKSCPKGKNSRCILKKKIKVDRRVKYIVQACVAASVGQPCKLVKMSDLRFTKQLANNNCEEATGQKGSITYLDLNLPAGKVLYINVKTKVKGQNSKRGFFVRPTRLTRNWGKAVVSNKEASFYLADTGQFSVEFASASTWRNYNKVSNFEGLMIFVNPEISLPNNLIPISPSKSATVENLGPNKKYLFVAGIDYDWGKDHVFKVHDNTVVYFEQGVHVRARIVQTEKKVNNILLKGYGTLDVHYDLEPDVVGVSDDATRQNIGIFGKNINVTGLTLIRTNPTCGDFGYCLNINANWSPLGDENDPFDAWELQQKDPPFKYRQAHCQENNMDDSPNTDFTNCPTSHSDGQKVSYVKCMTWQLGNDGLNAGKWGTIENSFVRTIDDAIKPWDSHGVYKNIVIWQLMLGWPINFGWWNWNQPDVDTLVDSIYVIHNQNWATSSDWPETQSGQCVIGGVYGSGAVKKGYQLSNIFVETAASCAVGLEISKDAYSRHPTPDGCVGSMIDMKIDGIYFDEEFYKIGNYENFLSGETNPNAVCTGDLSGKIVNMEISGMVAGRSISRSDFEINDETVEGLIFKNPKDPNRFLNQVYKEYTNKNTYSGQGSTEIDKDGVQVSSLLQCFDRCHSDWSCECIVFETSSSNCWKRGKCKPGKFESNTKYDTYLRQYDSV